MVSRLRGNEKRGKIVTTLFAWRLQAPSGLTGGRFHEGRQHDGATLLCSYFLGGKRRLLFPRCGRNGERQWYQASHS